MGVWTLNGWELAIMSSIAPFAVLVLFLVVVRFNPLFNKRQNTMLVLAVVVNLLMILAVGADFLLSGAWFEGVWIFRRITSFLNFAGSPVVPLLLYKIYDRGEKNGWLHLPALLNGVICAVSIFFQLVFFIRENNTYARGPLFILPFATSLFYIAIIFFKPNKNKPRSKRVERMLLLAIIGLLLLSMYLEIAFGLHMLTWNCSAVGLVLYYLLLNVHNFALDPLTGAYNRVMYSHALDEVNGNSPCTLALVDINDFKLVNDRYGHAAGDKCLVDVTGLLTQCFEGCAMVYRIGGDEFALLAKGRGRARFADCLTRARAAAAEQGIRFACGIAEYDGVGDIEESQRQMDNRMYQNKSEQKQG